MKRISLAKFAGIAAITSSSIFGSALNLNAESTKVVPEFSEREMLLSPENPYYIDNFFPGYLDFGVIVEGEYIDNPAPEKDYVKVSTYRMPDSDSVYENVNYVKTSVNWTEEVDGVSYTMTGSAESRGYNDSNILLQATYTSPLVYDDEEVIVHHSYKSNQ